MPGEGAANKKRVLVIEDDFFVRQYLCHVFSSLDYETAEASNGELGIAAFKAFMPDIIITDINMPNKTGFETISEIRAENSEIKIIAISGGGYTELIDNLEEAKRLGADRVLKKPFLPSDIKEVVNGF